MKVKVVYSNANDLTSKIVRWASKRNKESYPFSKISSHVSIVFEDMFLIDSTLFGGVAVSSYAKFLKSNIIVVEEQFDIENAHELIGQIIHQERDTIYDFWSALYLGVRRLSLRFFNIKLNTKNKWENNKKDYCVELLRYIDSYKNYDLSELLPHDLIIKRIGEYNGNN